MSGSGEDNTNNFDGTATGGLPGMQVYGDRRRRRAHQMVIASPGDVGPTLTCTVVMRPTPHECATSRGIVSSPKLPTATATTPTYSLTPTTALRQRRPTAAVVKSPRQLPANEATYYPLHSTVALRPHKRQAAVVRSARQLPANSATVYPLRSTVALRPSKRQPGQVYAPRLEKSTPVVGYSLTPTVALRTRRFNQAIVRSARQLPANQAAHYPLHATVALRPYKRQPAFVRSPQFHPATPLTHQLTPTKVLRAVRPRAALVIQPRMISAAALKRFRRTLYNSAGSRGAG